MKWFRSQEGMTLIEIMAVITIIGLISTFATVKVMRSLEEARQKKAKIQIKIFEDGLAHFRRDNGFYPATEQGLQALIEKPSIGRVPKHYPSGGYLDATRIPPDPFDCEYQYFSPGLQGYKYEIYSYGDNCEEGGEGVEADITSFEVDQ